MVFRVKHRGHQSVWVLLHTVVVPCLHTKLGSFFRAEVDEGESLGLLGFRIHRNHAAQNEMITEILLAIRTVLWLPNLLLPLESLIPENKVELFNDIVFATLVIKEANMDASVRIVITLCFM